MSSKKYIVLILAIAALGAGAYISERAFFASSHHPATTQETPTASNTASVTPATPSIKTTAEIPRQTPNITLSVGNTTYAAYAPEHTSVLDTMRTLASTSAFSFSGKEFPSLGFFVESINGKKNADGYYWILYINGKDSPTGASQTFLKSTDTIEWKYEKSY